MLGVSLHRDGVQRDLSMTEKERREVFNDPDNWVPSVEFPSNGMIRVLMFEFYGLMVYKLQIYTSVFHWLNNHTHEYVSDWETKFMFRRNGEHLELISMTDVWKLMKEAERKEMA